MMMKGAKNLAFHLWKVDFGRILTRYNQDVKVSDKSILVYSEKFLQAAFHEISPDCVFVNPPANSYGESA